MDQNQQKALNALEQYILLSKSAISPRAAADLVTQATSNPNTYVFAELLHTPNIQALQTGPPEYARFLTLLEIFSWGTWSDYTSTPDLPELSDAQAHKLRQLSLLSFANSHSTLTYPYLLQTLSLPSVRTLQDLVISSIYAGLLTAKLDTLGQRIDVSSVSPLRDVKPGSLPAMISVLDDWNARCVGVLAEIEAQVKNVRSKAAERKRREKEHERVFEKLVGEGGKGGGKRGAGEEVNGGVVGGDLGDAMDVDEGTAGKGAERTAKRGGKFSTFGRKLGR